MLINQNNVQIAWVIIHLDEDVPDCMSGIYRIGSVVIEDDFGKEYSPADFIDNDLVNNDEFTDHESLRNYVADKLKIDVSIVEIRE